MYVTFFTRLPLDQVLSNIINIYAHINAFVKSTTHSFSTERPIVFFIFIDMKLLVIIALCMKFFIALSAAGSYNEYDQLVHDEDQQNPILKAKLGALLLGKKLLLGKLLLSKKLLFGGILGFPYSHYPYGKLGYRYGPYNYGKLGRKFGIPGKGSYYDMQKQNLTLKGKLRKLLLKKKLLLRKILLLSRKIKLRYFKKLRKLGKLRYPIWRYFPYLYRKPRHGYGPYRYDKPGKPGKRYYYDVEEQKEY